MPSSQADPLATNRLMAALPSQDCEQLLANCEPIQLNYGEVLCRVGEVIPHVYFPTGSSISLVSPIDGGAGLERRG